MPRPPRVYDAASVPPTTDPLRAERVHAPVTSSPTRRRARAGSPAPQPHTGKVLVVLYLRLSDLRKENTSLEDREAALRWRAALLGWTVVRVVIENDEMKPGRKSGRRMASAFKRRRIVKPDGTEEWRVYRPGFRSILEDLTAGRAHALLAEDLDRSVRDPRDLEDLIDVVQRHGCSADSISGSLKFTHGGTDTEITTARLMVTVANKESRDKARRVADGRERSAAAGKWTGGPRPFGFGPLMTDAAGRPVLDPRTGEHLRDYYAVVPEEAEALKSATDAVLGGVALKACARDLARRGVPTVTGAAWSAETLRDILRRPRNAGLSEYDGEIVADALWPAIVPREKWEAVVRMLDQPDRRTGPGPAAKWLGTGIFLCGICGARLHVRSLKGSNRVPGYICSLTGHLRRRLDLVDEWVECVVMRRLKMPDTASLLLVKAQDMGIDVGALQARAAELRRNRSDLTVDKTLGRCSAADYVRAVNAANEELSAIEEKLSAAAGDSLLAPLIGADDVEAAWTALPLGARREVLRRLVKVTILPIGHTGGGSTRFNRDAIRIEQPDGGEVL